MEEMTLLPNIEKIKDVLLLKKNYKTKTKMNIFPVLVFCAIKLIITKLMA